MRSLYPSLILNLLAPNIVLAAMGPNLEASIKANLVYMNIHSIFTGVILLASIIVWMIYKRYYAIPIIALIVLAIHPRWTLGGDGGDGGTVGVMASTVYSIVLLGLFIYQVVFSIKNKKREQ